MNEMKQLTTEQMELLMLICAITDYADTDVNYDTAVDETISSMVSEKVASEENYDYLEKCGYITDEYFATLKGKQCVKLFNEYCTQLKNNINVNVDNSKSFSLINVNEISLSLVKVPLLEKVFSLK